ncbi:MAG: hypothetical protein KF795_21890 [Labilithrix sp.]|nr:hypothetical protein [Labilithrix sp.]
MSDASQGMDVMTVQRGKERDVLDEVVRAMTDAPRDAYWARRLLDLVRDPVVATRLRSHIVTAVQRWAAHDPSFFVHERYLSEQLAVWAWPREVLEDLDAKLALDDSSLTHLVMGRLWLEARRPPEDMPQFYARALRHLREVAPRLQVGAWHEAMCEALGVADPAELALRAGAILETVASSDRDRVLLAILRGAARTGDWALYDAYRRAYGAGDTDGARRNSELVRLDGQRAEQLLAKQAIVPSFRRARPPAPKPAEPKPAEPQEAAPEEVFSEAKTVRPPSRPR